MGPEKEAEEEKQCWLIENSSKVTVEQHLCCQQHVASHSEMLPSRGRQSVATLDVSWKKSAISAAFHFTAKKTIVA